MAPNSHGWGCAPRLASAPRPNAAPTTRVRDQPWRRLRAIAPFLAVYDAAWLAFTAIWLLARLVWRRGHGTETCERLGKLPQRPPGATVAVWIHAVSVGEVLSTRPVVAALKQRHPDWWVVLTVGNAPAYELASKQPAGADVVCWQPWDFRPCVQRALERVQPDLLVLVECELWPNLIAHATRRAVRVVMMNGRIYERDFARYLRGRRLFAPLLQATSFIGTQSASDRDRFLALGAPPHSTLACGNTKFDVALPCDLAQRLAALRRVLPLGAGPLWILASTHADEEEPILARLDRLRARFPGLQILIAPRHVERAPAILAMAATRGLSVVCRSGLAERKPLSPVGTTPNVVVLDTIGELATVLGLADLVFVGGSLVDRGGQNAIEPALHARAILLGPSWYNFREVVQALHDANAVEIVADADELVRRAGVLLADDPGRRVLGHRAAAEIRRHAGASAEYLRVFEEVVAERFEQSAMPARTRRAG